MSAHSAIVPVEPLADAHELPMTLRADVWQLYCQCRILPAFRWYQGDSAMYAILRGANGRRHEVDFGDDPVVVDVAMSDVTVQITMTAPGDLDPDRARFVTVTVLREQLVAAMAEAVNRRSNQALFREMRRAENETISVEPEEWVTVGYSQIW